MPLPLAMMEAGAGRIESYKADGEDRITERTQKSCVLSSHSASFSSSFKSLAFQFPYTSATQIGAKLQTATGPQQDKHQYWE